MDEGKFRGSKDISGTFSAGEMKAEDGACYYVGIDVGSTTTKIAVIEPETGKLIYSDYRRHGARQVKNVGIYLNELKLRFPGIRFCLVLTGSGAKLLSDHTGLMYVQEVVANSIAIRKLYGNVSTAIELGGQDAKILFFKQDPGTGALDVADMRMNGSCAGGTGAFLDEVASILKLKPEELNRAAEEGTAVYDISGRCGVYAKTDIQPLLNQGVPKADLVLSTFHAIAKQTIGGLAQGLDIKGPVIFEGGPMNYNPKLIDVFAERLGLEDKDILIPEHPEMMVAYGAALSINELYSREMAGIDIDEAIDKVNAADKSGLTDESGSTPVFFKDDAELADFLKKHPKPIESFGPKPGQKAKAYLGIDSGSTTTKFVLIDEEENILDSFYASNGGSPLDIAKNALIALRRRWQAAGAELEIIATGTTGYGELLFEKAFGADYHTVETVAHTRAAVKYVPDATFLLDIGGQDMKAIWIDRGVITNIVVNEACSSGCGSFLENFAASLQIPVQDIEKAAFASRNPAALGSRCTVFMNSSIVTAQRTGKNPDDIMAGLCRSIIENVFTKVIRVSNIDSLGDKIVVQGGTFRNDAVLRALEQYLGREVTRSPYTGMMGALGVAILTKEDHEARLKKGENIKSPFIGLDNMDGFHYEQLGDSVCPFCGNHCKRQIMRFSNGNTWVTNNRCERGEVIGDPEDEAVRKELKEKTRLKDATPDLFKLRERLLFKDYLKDEPKAENIKKRGITIGLPRVLSFWDNMPFWTTFFRTLGFDICFSGSSTRKMYESGLAGVTSDTICFPAKLVHGHLRDLAAKKPDRIFMPSVTTMPSENQVPTSQSMCAVVKGYQHVIRNSDNPEKRFGIPFDTPLFHWYTEKDCMDQLSQYMKNTYGIKISETRAAIRAADAAMREFKSELKAAGKKVMEEAKANGSFAVVLASRPYQNDSLVNHDLPEMFTSLGIPVLTADSIPDSESVDLSRSTVEIVNNFHARMLSTAIMAAERPELEYVQIMSFGCGHDAYLSDEITRLMREISGKTPLIVKLDESDIQGPLRIRVRSFLETLKRRREDGGALGVNELPEPYPVKYTVNDRKRRVVLIPNTSHAFSRIMAAAFASQGIITESLPIGRKDAVIYGKRYVHNDICFPAQMVIGEALSALKSGKYDADDVAIGMGKYMGDCRLTHYSKLLRKALDDAGFKNVPILTNDDQDPHELHPGFKMNLLTSVRIAYALPMIDALEGLLRKIRPYELKKGSAEKAFNKGLDALVIGLREGGVAGAKKGFAKAIGYLKAVAYDRSKPRPGVLIVGEYLLNFHPGANHDIEAYLEKNGFEIIEAHMTDVIQKTYFTKDTQIREYHLNAKVKDKSWYRMADQFFDMAHDAADRIASAHPLYTPPCRLNELVKDSDAIIQHTFDSGEGVLIPAEIIHHAKHGCRNFVILQPFGCLPNHIVGRGIVKRLKEMYPDVQILSLDYDPDVSFANIENRLQMLVMNERMRSK